MESKLIESRFPESTTPLFSDSISKLHAAPTPVQNEHFLHAFIFLRDLIREILDGSSEETQAYSYSSTVVSTYSDDTIHESISIDVGTYHFGAFLHELSKLKEEGLLLPEIQRRREELFAQKGHWRSFIDTLKEGKEKNFYLEFETVFQDGKLIANGAGAGSSYFLVDGQGRPRFVIKPVDEDILCINNRKEFGSPFNDIEHRVRNDIPLYRSAQTDAFCWEVASMAGIENSTPRAVMGIAKSDRFYDFTKWISEERKEKFIAITGIPDKEKLCSIQEFIPESQDLFELMHELYAQGLTDEEIASRFDQKDFEEVCLFLWLTYDTDGHGGNFRTYVKRIDETGKKIYGIKKIDNGLSFPEKNTQHLNMLAWSANAIVPISDDLKQKIAGIPIDRIVQRMSDYEMEGSAAAFKERVEILQSLAKRGGITVGEIDLRLSVLSHENGRELALNTMTTKQFLDLIIGTKPDTLKSSTQRGTHEAA